MLTCRLIVPTSLKCYHLSSSSFFPLSHRFLLSLFCQKPNSQNLSSFQLYQLHSNTDILKVWPLVLLLVVSSHPSFSFISQVANFTNSIPKPHFSNTSPIQNLYRPKMPVGTSVHITALDGIVNVNSLFTLAVFLGLTWNPSDPNNSLNLDSTCTPGPSVGENLVAFHVYSFSSFLFSSLIALALKQAVRITRTPSYHPNEFFRINKSILRVGMLVSAVGSFCGCGFLMMALVNVVQIKLGTFSCGSSASFAAVVPLFILVPIALLIYACVVMYAFTR